MTLYNGKSILAGLALFVALVTFPFWFSLAAGRGAAPPKPVPNPEGVKCVEPAEFMRASHMQLLTQWRDEVVRENKREYLSTSGVKFEKSLSNTCMDCHADKPGKKKVAIYCVDCHDYAGVDPYCWDCHIDPQQTN